MRQLEKSGVVSRHVQETVPPVVTYSLTARGQTLKQAITSLSDWGLHHAPRIDAQILVVEQAKPRGDKVHDVS